MCSIRTHALGRGPSGSEALGRRPASPSLRTGPARVLFAQQSLGFLARRDGSRKEEGAGAGAHEVERRQLRARRNYAIAAEQVFPYLLTLSSVCYRHPCVKYTYMEGEKLQHTLCKMVLDLSCDFNPTGSGLSFVRSLV